MARKKRHPHEDTEQPIRILLVEDSRTDADFVKEILSRSRTAYQVNCVDRLSMAIAVLKGPAPLDIVLLDFCLPDSEGIGTFERLARGRLAAADHCADKHQGQRSCGSRSEQRGARLPGQMGRSTRS